MFHRIRLFVFVIVVSTLVAATAAYGWDYYRLPLAERVVSGKNLQLRPSGTIGLKLGMLGVALFACLYMYPLRKRWKWLQKFGKTKNWLDFHVLFGISAPLVITLHSSLKLQGIAGVAYWLMIAVMLSGFVGRYFYAQIPRSLNATALTVRELDEMSSSMRGQIQARSPLSANEFANILSVPEATDIQRMSLLKALLVMVWLDICRPFQVAQLRRGFMTSTGEKIRSLGGILSSGDDALETVISLVRRQSWLITKMAFLDRTNQVFQLWHVVHRPFSYSFAVLAVVHITLVLLLGYY
jgi:hypothetical protein